MNNNKCDFQIVADLEKNNIINEQSASVIKSLIIEENTEVFKVINEYIDETYDEDILSKYLSKLAGKLSQYIVRPTSPFPKKDELIKMVNSLVRKRLRDDNDLLLLNKLILDEDELVYSSFDVFESDRDEEDLLDTLVRIVQKYKRIGKFANKMYATTFYSSKKILLNENNKEFTNSASLRQLKSTEYLDFSNLKSMKTTETKLEAEGNIGSFEKKSLNADTETQAKLVNHIINDQLYNRVEANF